MKFLRHLFLILFLAGLSAGCHQAQSVIRPVAVPSAAPVRSHLVAAQAANDRLTAIITKAQKTGLAAGSPEFEAVVKVNLEQRTQLFQAQQAINLLDAQLLDTRKAADAQTAKLNWYVEKYDEAIKKIWWYRWHFLVPLIVAAALLFLTVAVVVLSKFTAWGARTFGPYLVSAEHVAIKGAALAALA